MTSKERNLLLLSASFLKGKGFLEHGVKDIREILKGKNSVLFIPYARPGGGTYDEVTKLVRERFNEMGFELHSIHENNSPRKAIDSAEALYVGGGNTFVLLKEMYAVGIIDEIRSRVAEGMPYLGASAGANVAGQNIGTTNDMPIVLPPSLDSLELVPFNINPHYVDPDKNPKNRQETREARIKEFQVFNPVNVVALRDASMLRVAGKQIYLRGGGARVFMKSGEIKDCNSGARLDFLLE